MKTAFFDVDTQLDFLYPAGALAVPDGASLLPGLAELTRFAASNKIALVSTTDAHTEDDVEFQSWPPHCVAGSFGQMKAGPTLLPGAVTLPNAAITPDRLQNYAQAPQVIVQKQNIDCFTNISLRPFLEVLRADSFVVYGIVAEVCVEKALFGLLQYGARVQCVTDGIKAISNAAMRNMLAHFQAAGGKLTTISEVTARRRA